MAKTPRQLRWDRERLVSPHTQADKSTRVRHMFDSVAPRYRRVNRLFSAGRDAVWRRRAAALVGATEGDAVLDVACGTGDFLRALSAVVGPRSRLVGCDFSHEMLRAAAHDEGDGGPAWIEADALRLPLVSESFNVVSCAFGVRNFQDLDAGLLEMRRVLRVGGRVVILEFTRPRNRWFRLLYEFYAHRVMPWAAAWVSGDRTGAYRYLPRSVVSFISAVQMCARLEQAGFGKVTATTVSRGIVSVYVGTKLGSTDG